MDSNKIFMRPGKKIDAEKALKFAWLTCTWSELWRNNLKNTSFWAQEGPWATSKCHTQTQFSLLMNLEYVTIDRSNCGGRSLMQINEKHNFCLDGCSLISQPSDKQSFFDKMECQMKILVDESQLQTYEE